MGALLLSLAAFGCSADVESADTTDDWADTAACVGASPDLPDVAQDAHDSLPPGEEWELAPVQLEDVTVAPEEDFVPADLFKMTEEDWNQAHKNAMEDPLWYAEDGQRFETLFITDSGTVYGRRGPAQNRPIPTAASGFGASEVMSAAEHPSTDQLAMLNDATPTAAAPPASPIADFAAPLNEPEPVPNYVGTDYWNDSRIRTGGSTALASFPARTIGPLSGSGSVSAGGCSGSKIGPRSIITASHCVLSLNGSVQYSGYFNPGQSRSTAINGSYRWSGLYLRDWRVGRRYDYAVLRGPDNSTLVSKGWLGVVWWNSASSYDWRVSVINGYPCGPNGPQSCGATTTQRCNASPRTDKRCDGWMYGDDTYLHSNLYNYYESGTLAFYNDVSKGMSGSSIRSTGNNVMGLAVACPSETSSTICYGPRFRTSMWNDVCGWIAAMPSSHGTHPLCN